MRRDDRLRAAFEEHQRLAIPDLATEDDELEDARGDLMHYDSGVAGVVDSLCSGVSPDPEQFGNVKPNVELRGRLIKLVAERPETSADAARLLDYLDAVEKLAAAAGVHLRIPQRRGEASEPSGG